jgi:hypothetical protein
VEEQVASSSFDRGYPAVFIFITASAATVHALMQRLGERCEGKQLAERRTRRIGECIQRVGLARGGECALRAFDRDAERDHREHGRHAPTAACEEQQRPARQQRVAEQVLELVHAVERGWRQVGRGQQRAGRDRREHRDPRGECPAPHARRHSR